MDKITDMAKKHSPGRPYKPFIPDQDSIVQESAPLAYASNWAPFFDSTQKGVLASEVAHLCEITSFKEEFFCKALDISTKTLSRYIHDKKRFNPNDSELVLKWKALFEEGRETFGSYDSFCAWLSKPSIPLYQVLPKDLIQTSRGVDVVMEELSRIQWGNFS